MIDWITHLLNSLGYPAIVLLMSAENLFPSELVMPLTGFTAAQGELSPAGVIIAGTLGAILNALPPCGTTGLLNYSGVGDIVKLG